MGLLPTKLEQKVMEMLVKEQGREREVAAVQIVARWWSSRPSGGYRILRGLRDRGWIELRKEGPVVGREWQFYRLTEEGAKMLAAVTELEGR